MSHLLSPHQIPGGQKQAKYAQVSDDDSLSIDDELVSPAERRDFLITSRWDSKLFDVKPQTPKESGFKLSDYFYEHIDRRTRFLVIPTFGIVGLLSFLLAICSLVGVIAGIVTLYIIIIVTWLGACVGMFGVYRWGMLLYTI